MIGPALAVQFEESGAVETLQVARLAALIGDLNHERSPLYLALASRLRLLVGDGRLPVGVRLPAERELSSALGLSRATITAAYRTLRDDGWASARQGSGTWTRLPAGPAQGAWIPTPSEPGVLDLAQAAPTAPPEISAAFTAAMADLPRLLPGHGYHPGGLPELRARIADRYTARGLPTTAEQVLVTAGALHAITVALAVLVRRGQRVLVEHPSYPNALDAIAAMGAGVVPVAVSSDEPEAIAGDMHRAARQTSPRVAYLMPDFQNPTGLLLDDSQRRRMSAGLEQTNVVALVDETLVDLALDAEPPLPFAAIARPEMAVTVGSMSKSFWGGLRIGWLRAEAEVVRQFAAAAVRSQMSGPVLEQLAACHLLDAADSALPAHRNRIRQQRDALVTGLSERLPQWRVRVPSGGLVLWCELPNISSAALVAAAEWRGLRLAAGSRFGTGHAFDDRLRLPYTQPVEVLVRAVDLLAEAAVDLEASAPRAQADQLVL
jgi:DNA-binding transcriptional MocR family regulator